MEQTLKTTSLFACHQLEKAKIVPFAGWQMPLEYTGILQEHRAVRQDKGLFDLSHMGEIEVGGPDAFDFVQGLITGNLASLRPGQALYTVMCREDGGILDDLVVYFLSSKYLLVVNASNTQKIWDWVQDNKGSRRITLQDRSEETALLSVQGPNSEFFLQPFFSRPLKNLSYYCSMQTETGSLPVLISRTGYTGEDGFEIYVDSSKAETLWKAFRDQGVPPVGLGARDTLRLEAAYPLYGNDMDESTTPLEAGLSWVVKFEKEKFIGKEFLLKQKQAGIPRRQVPFVMKGKGIPRHDYPVMQDGAEIGRCTSGTYSPTLEKGIGLGLVETSRSQKLEIDSTLFLSIRNEMHEAIVSKKPFVQGSVKRGS